jgi:hypothetical protein
MIKPSSDEDLTTDSFQVNPAARPTPMQKTAKKEIKIGQARRARGPGGGIRHGTEFAGRVSRNIQ